VIDRRDAAPLTGASQASAVMPWATAVALAAGPAVGMGLARFAYALLLPAMRLDLAWSFTQAGAMNTANSVGYLAGALGAAPVLKRTGSRRLFLGGIFCAALATLLSAATGAFAPLLVLRVVAGVAGAMMMVAGAGMAAQLGNRQSRARARLILGIYFGGAGLGIVLSGLLVPVVLMVTGPHGWRAGWIVLGVFSLAAAAASTPSILRAATPPRSAPGGTAAWSPRPIALLFVAYTLFGAGYISYMTFIIAFLRSEAFGAAGITAFWVVLGIAACISTFTWGPLVSRARGGRAVGALTGMLVLGALLPLLSRSPGVAFASAVCFGGSFLALTTAVAEFGRRAYPAHHWNTALAVLTAGFAAGQCAGPVVAGVLSDGPSGVRAGLALSVGVLVLSTLFAVAQPHREGPISD